MFEKVKTIVKAFTEPLPIGEAWYEERMGICNACERNTKNMEQEALAALDRIKLTVGLCPEGDHCTACGCCTHRKASQKSEACGMVDLGLPPKWTALTVTTNLDKKITAENLTPTVGRLMIADKKILYDLGESANERHDFSIGLSRSGHFKIKSITAACGCTVAVSEETGENAHKISITLTVKSLKPGNTTLKNLTVHYYGDSAKAEELPIQIKFKKTATT